MWNASTSSQSPSSCRWYVDEKIPFHPKKDVGLAQETVDEAQMKRCS